MNNIKNEHLNYRWKLRYFHFHSTKKNNKIHFI